MQHARTFPGLFRKGKNHRLMTRETTAQACSEGGDERKQSSCFMKWEGGVDVFMYMRIGWRECNRACLGWHALPTYLWTRYNARYTRHTPVYSAKRSDAERTRPWNKGEKNEEEKERRETRSICKPRRIAYFKAITVRFSCPEDDGIALSFVRPAVKNDPR